MTNEKPNKPKAGDMFLDPVNKMWRDQTFAETKHVLLLESK